MGCNHAGIYVMWGPSRVLIATWPLVTAHDSVYRGQLHHFLTKKSVVGPGFRTPRCDRARAPQKMSVLRVVPLPWYI